jgi:hypothetical protein
MEAMRNCPPFLRPFVLLAALGGVASAAAPAPAKVISASPAAPRAVTAGYTGKDPCKVALEGDSPVAQACKDGGAKAAKTKMKAMVASAKKKGESIACDNCHSDTEDFTKLNKDAKDRFKRLVELTK